jgi:hypothetical protein
MDAAKAASKASPFDFGNFGMNGAPFAEKAVQLARSV